MSGSAGDWVDGLEATCDPGDELTSGGAHWTTTSAAKLTVASSRPFTGAETWKSAYYFVVGGTDVILYTYAVCADVS